MRVSVRCIASFTLPLIVLVAFTGCLEGDGNAAGGGPDAEASYRLGGTFTRNATQEDMSELGARAAEHGSEMAFMESYPVQFAARDLSEDACEDLRAFAASREYVASVTACEVQAQASGNPDEAVTNDGAR